MRHSILGIFHCAALFVMAIAPQGCFLVIDDPDCGHNARRVRGHCECRSGYVGDPYDECWPAEAVQDWVVVDACNDGQDVTWRLFSADRQVQWPGGTEAYLTAGFGVDTVQSIVCVWNEAICFGGQSGTRTWGCGLDGNIEPCFDWCYECGDDVVDLGYLTCPERKAP